MATEQHSVEAPQGPVETDSLQPFSGLFSPGVCFASGHCLWLFRWSSTPTVYDAYDNIWLITPDDERILYVDPQEAGPVVEKYHEFDRTVGATLAWSQADFNLVAVALEGDDGTTLEFRAELGPSTGTRLLNAITSVTPQPILRTGVGKRISNLSLGLLMDVNGLKVAGITETDEPYRVEPDRLRAVNTATATLNGEDLGDLAPPERLIEFGDAIVPDEPFFTFGDLYLRPPSGGVV